VRLTDYIRARITDYTPGVGRVFVVCGAGPHVGCNKVVPHYRLYGKGIATLGCTRCGNTYVRPANIPEWKAALWLAWGYLTRKGDPRMPLRMTSSPYA
jgi:hypothetical protein